MASGSILTSGPSPEEQKEADRLAQEEWDKTHSRKQIQGGMDNTYRVPGGGEIETYTLKNGTQGFQKDGNTYYLNNDNGRWESNTRRQDYYNLGDIAPPSEGGGGEAPAPTQSVSGQGVLTDPGVSTKDVLGGYNQMQDWQPISRNIGGVGTQGMNPLVDPGQWLHVLQPQPVYSPGQYQGPGIGLLQQNYANGLLGG